MTHWDVSILEKGREKKWDDRSDPRDRAESFRCFEHRSDDLIIPATGGMGTIRTLAALRWFNWAGWAQHKIAVGFSDATAFAVKVATYSVYPALHGPCFEDKELVEALPYYTLQKSDWKIPYTFIDCGSANP